MLCNYANGDMVGHTGSIPATIKAVETVDACLARVIDAAAKAGARLLVTADHGNCEMMIDPADGRAAHRAHHESRCRSSSSTTDGAHRCARAARSATSDPRSSACSGSSSPHEMTGRDLRLA